MRDRILNHHPSLGSHQQLIIAKEREVILILLPTLSSLYTYVQYPQFLNKVLRGMSSCFVINVLCFKLAAQLTHLPAHEDSLLNLHFARFLDETKAFLPLSSKDYSDM